jgi:hypothetical protein
MRSLFNAPSNPIAGKGYRGRKALAKERTTLRTNRCKVCVLLFAVPTLLAAPLNAQAPPSTGGKPDRESEKAASRVGQVVERVEPDIFYTRDKNGDLVPLLDYSWEEIKRLLELKAGTPTAPRSSFRIEQLAIGADAVGDHATLSIELSIVANDSGWVRVPLRMGNLVLTDAPNFADEGEHYVDFDIDGRERVAWIRGKADQSHVLSLRGLVRLENDGTQTRLRLNAPRAVFSEMQLTVPHAAAVGQMNSGGILVETSHDAGRTQFRARGLGTDFAIAWRNADVRPVESPTVFSAEGQIVSHVDGQGVDTTATLRVTAFGHEFTGFQVRLPPGATLVSSDQSDYSLSQISPSENSSEIERQRPIVDVKLKTKTASAVAVKIQTQQGHEMTRAGAFELGGFDVIGAVRQSGVLAVHASDDWQVAFAAPQGVMQTDELPSDMRVDGVVAGFIYYGQYSLSAHVSRRQSRTSVDPSYVVEVGPHHLQLDGTLKYHIAGAKVFSFSMELGDWQLDSGGLGPAALVNSAALVFGPGSPVLIPLKQATTGDIELKIRARRPLPPGIETISFALPRLAADTVGSTELVVVPDDNVVLTPRSDELLGLTSAPPSRTIRLGSYHQSPWFYRSDMPDLRFVAAFHVASQRLTSRTDSKVTLSREEINVAQTISCTVEHEAAESLLLFVPQALAKEGPLTVDWQGKRLSLDPVASDDAPSGDQVAVRVHFPEPQLGEVELGLTYVWRDEALGELASHAATVRTEIPLVMPGEGDFDEARLTLSAEPDIHIEPVDKSWIPRGAASPDSARQNLFFISAQPRTSLTLGISPKESTTTESAVVDRIWIQTWLTEQHRFDRAVFRLHSRANKLRLKLPPSQTAESFRLDGEEIVAAQGESSDERVFVLPASGSIDVAYVLELTCELEDHSRGHGQCTVALPQLVGVATARHFYWQVVLPRGEYLLTGPPGLANCFAWVWTGLGWSRQPLLSSSELEVWSGAQGHEQPLPASINSYLFSGPAPQESIQITTVSRPVLVFLASGLSLAVGLLWIYFPSVRRPALIFIAGVALLSSAAVWPDLSLLATQAAVIGAALVVLAIVLERRLGRRPSQVASRRSSSSIVSRHSTHSHPRVVVPTGASTQTAALAVELGADAES